MEYSDFAERILFGTSLDDKLIRPASMSDAAPRGLTQVPVLPGRPAALVLDGDAPRRKVPFPSVSELDQPRVRGHVLHFFANHELLALELMALMLLKFPDAPESYRRGLVETMLEEQRHMQMYRARMEQAGVEFGEIPVNAFFWNCLRDVDNPLDFVAGMSMTFEQANLDFAGYYARAFRRMGDTDTADVLDIVYEEEIGHVKHGVVWFDRWRPPRERSAFRAWQIALPETISPARARGTMFDEEARRRAGFDDEFITSLRLFRASRGRPPVVHVFNPACEEENRGGANYQPPAHISRFEHDLQQLPMFLAAEEDIVLVDSLPSLERRDRLDRAGLTIPEFVVAGRKPEEVATAIRYRHLTDLQPWGWSPRQARLLAPLAERLVGGRDVALASRLAGATLPPRFTLHALLDEALEQERGERRLSFARRDRSVVARTSEEVEAALAALSETYARAVIKGAWGASGRSAVRAQTSAPDAHARRAWTALLNDGPVVVEPWLERIADYSWQFQVTEDAVIHYGPMRIVNDARGQFGAALLNRHSDGLPTEVLRFIHDEGGDTRWVRRYQERVAERVAAALRGLGYQGPAGIDAMLVREGGELRFDLGVEVNPRLTMGRLAVELEKRVSRRRSSLFAILPLKELDTSYEEFESRWPLKTAGEGAKKLIDEGMIWLNDVGPESAWGAALLVAERHEVLVERAKELRPMWFRGALDSGS